MSLIQLYRDLTIVRIGDGKTTCFWLDSWLGNKPLFIQYPALFSHVQSPNATIADCFSKNGWVLRLRHIMAHTADQEMGLLLARLDQVALSDGRDDRFMHFGPDKNFLVKSCYYTLSFGGVSCAGNQEIWSSLAPKKCKNFAWLARCPFGCQTEEGLTHLLSLCPHTFFL
jgi:hypothetical protein